MFGQNEDGNKLDINLYNISNETNFVIDLKSMTTFAKESFNFSD